VAVIFVYEIIQSMGKFQVHEWQRDDFNPIFPPSSEWFDSGCCMNACVLRQGDEYWMFYAGSDAKGHRRICLAIAPVGDHTNWKRLGPLFDIGEPGSFDANWCVLPCIHKFGDKWHMYYTGHTGRGAGLQAFGGMGLAVSDDLLHWERYSTEPILRGDGFEDWPGNKGIAGGGGRIHEIEQPDGSILYRMHYTLATGTPSPDLLVDQAKQAVMAHSYDGITWFDRRVIMRARLAADYENAAAVGLNIWKTPTRYRAVYSGIGTRFGAYSICEAVSEDGLVWDRGEPGENLSLAPQGDGWESQMVEYPNIVEEDGKLRMFYCGNGYGRTGIGTAVAEMLD